MSTEKSVEQSKPQGQKPDTVVAKGEVVQDPPEAANPLLVQILSTRRAHGSTGDTNFRLWLFNYIKTTLKLPATIEVEGNILVQTDPRSTVLFSCHVDTVHSTAESNGQAQQLAYDPAFGHLFLAEKDKSGCLGGDDGCGVYIMLRMLAAGVKGKFIFHTGEERGGIGSSAFVHKRKQFCEDLEMVVAFDRAVRSGESPEVIITQGGTECASKEFGEALCKELNTHGGFDQPYVISHKGSFTDSKNYRSLVPECVNIGCFYEHQHSPKEYVDVRGLEKLVTAACKVAWDKLPIIRKVAEPYAYVDNDDFFGMAGFNPKSFTNGGSKSVTPLKPQVPKKPEPKTPQKFQPELSALDEMRTWTMHDFEMYASEVPEQASLSLMQLVLKVSALEAELDAAKAMLGFEY